MWIVLYISVFILKNLLCVNIVINKDYDTAFIITHVKVLIDFK